ncbi:MAG TPA: sensor histidine kinase [Bryobacteraceae bacterium]|nr:sensor histidine kinase [Bryobacteraceae bacterium]
MESRRTPTARLLAGLAVTLCAVAVYSGYTIVQLRGLERLQTTTIDRNRLDSLLLLRIQNSLNSAALTMRDMLDGSEPYPLSAWRAPFLRIRNDLADAMGQEARYAPAGRNADQGKFLAESVAQFWDALDRTFALADAGEDGKARDLIRLSLEARQEALTSAVARLLVENNASEQQAALETRAIYGRAARNVYLFLAAMLVLIVLTSVYLLDYNRRLFARVADLSERRAELAQQLISMQENTLGAISRELHDDFGQILTAIGVMLQRPVREPDLREIQQVVQDTLEKVRSLSRALHPVILDEAGLESALDAYLPGFEKQTGIGIRYEREGSAREIERGVAIHLYRVVQEALSNVARHSQSKSATVRLRFDPRALVLEVEDAGMGFGRREKQGMGMVSMRERAELVGGRVEFLEREGGGAVVRMTVPAGGEAAGAAAGQSRSSIGMG